MALPSVDQSSGRLLYPMVREGGKLRRASWEEALSAAAERMTSIRERYGPDAFGAFSCSKSTNELNYLVQKFMQTAIGTNNIDSCNRT